MNTVLEQLNLTPQERRVVVVIAVIVFIVLNALLVWPHFKDLGAVRGQLKDTRDTIQKWNAEVERDVDKSTNGYQVVLSKLQQQQGGGVVNQQVQLQRSVSDQAMKTGVNMDEIRPVNPLRGDTNRFYDEQSVRISFECDEAQLVNFLFNVGNDPAMIRVQELNLHTADANRYRLKGDAILTANYSKQPTAPAKNTATTAGAAPKPAAGSKPMSPAPFTPPHPAVQPPIRPNMVPRPAPGPMIPH